MTHKGIWAQYQGLRWWDLDGLGNAIRLKMAEYWTEKQYEYGIGLYIHGEKGTGKTSIATYILKRVLANGTDVFCTSFMDLLKNRKDYGMEQEDKEWYSRILRSVGVLLIDDPGRESSTNINQKSWNTEILDSVIYHRTNMGLATILTTNKAPESNPFGEGVTGSINESLKVVHVVGKDYRLKAMENREIEKRANVRRPVAFE